MSEDRHHILVSPDGLMTWNGRTYRCALGKGGISTDKTEGDGATPVGRFPLRRVLWRADRLPEPPATCLPLAEIGPSDGWCDDPRHPDYNRPVTLPHPARHEVMMRDDHVYDVVVVLGHNDDPPVPGRGSAIFMHVAREDYQPTEGCIALNLDDLLEVLASLPPAAVDLVVLAEPPEG